MRKVLVTLDLLAGSTSRASVNMFDLDTQSQPVWQARGRNARQHSVQDVRTSKNSGMVMGLRVILARSLSVGSIPIISTNNWRISKIG